MNSWKKAQHASIRTLIWTVLPFLFACAPINDEKELLGGYQLWLPNGFETLTLLPDGKCDQEIRLNNGETYCARGSWKYDKASEYLSLRGIRVSLDGFGRMNPKIAEIANGIDELPVVRKLMGGFRIGLGDDVYYEKQRP